MVEILIPYVQKRGRGYRYRRVVPAKPPQIRKAIGCKNWLVSFKPGTPVAVVEREARRLAAKHDTEIAAARGEDVTPEQIAKAEANARSWLTEDRAKIYEMLEFMLSTAPDEGLSAADQAFVSALENSGRYRPQSLNLSAALKRDVELYGQDRDPKPPQYAVDSFVKAIGDKDVTTITRADVSEWLAAQEKAGLAPATIKRRLGALGALVGRAYLDFDHDGRNPFARHQIKRGAGGANDRLPFNRAMLDLIDAYLASSKRLGHETRNMIRIMKATGAGPAEVGGLAVADVSLDSDVPFIWVRHNALRGVKADARDRQIPLIGDALTAAKDALTRAQGGSPDTSPVFSSFGISGRGADSISAKINKALRSAGIPKSPRLTGYSFRHTIKESLRSAGVADHIQRRVLGHAGQGVADRYGSPRARLTEARDALTAALDHLGDVDPSIYSERERFE